MPGAKVFKLGRLTQVMRVRGVDVYVHWSVLLIVTIMLAGTLRRPVMTIVGGRVAWKDART